MRKVRLPGPPACSDVPPDSPSARNDLIAARAGRQGNIRLVGRSRASAIHFGGIDDFLAERILVDDHVRMNVFDGRRLVLSVGVPKPDVDRRLRIAHAQKRLRRTAEQLHRHGILK